MITRPTFPKAVILSLHVSIVQHNAPEVFEGIENANPDAPEVT